MTSIHFLKTFLCFWVRVRIRVEVRIRVIGNTFNYVFGQTQHSDKFILDPKFDV